MNIRLETKPQSMLCCNLETLWIIKDNNEQYSSGLVHITLLYLVSVLHAECYIVCIYFENNSVYLVQNLQKSNIYIFFLPSLSYHLSQEYLFFF